MASMVDGPKLTPPFITRFEVARLIGIRVLQINDQNIQLNEGETPTQRAIREIREGTSSAVLRRHLPDNTFEDVAVRSLSIDSQMLDFQLNPSVM